MKSDVIIIGAGISGMTAAIYLKRAGVSPILIEGKRPGGQINSASLVENFPSYEKISGRELAVKVLEQVKALGVEPLKDEVVQIEEQDSGYRLLLKSGKSYFSKTVFLATGKKIKRLEIPHVNDFLGIGLSYCATCDGRFFEGKDVLVVGNTNQALEEAVYLSHLCRKVTILSEFETVRADSFYLEKVLAVSNIEVIPTATILELLKEDVVVGARILRDGKEEVLPISGCFAYVGYVPNSELVSHLVELNGDNYIVVDKNKQTSCKGIYAIGDVTDTSVYQLVTAAGDAAIAVNHYLSQK